MTFLRSVYVNEENWVLIGEIGWVRAKVVGLSLQYAEVVLTVTMHVPLVLLLS